jgi:hypothetical protein
MRNINKQLCLVHINTMRNWGILISKSPIKL